MAAHKGNSGTKKPMDQQHGNRTIADKLRDTEVDLPNDPPPEPPDANPEWTDTVTGIWESLLDSPLRSRFEKSDWNFYKFACDFLSDTVESGYPSGKMMTARQILNDMMLTEASRISANVRINRAPPEEDPRKTSSMARAQAQRDQRKAS